MSGQLTTPVRVGSGVEQLEQEWLQQKGWFKIGFLLDSVQQAFKQKERRFVVLDENDKLQAFLNLFSYANGTKYYIQNLIQKPKGHKFALDFLISNLILLLESERVIELNFGFCPFQKVIAQSWHEHAVSLLGHFAPSYNPSGLYYFKKKFTNQESKGFLALDPKYSLMKQVVALFRVTYSLKS